jgi:hypothetical protein
MPQVLLKTKGPEPQAEALIPGNTKKCFTTEGKALNELSFSKRNITPLK